MTPKSDHEEDMSMEEILASIRRFVADTPSAASEKPPIYKGDQKDSVVIPPQDRIPLEFAKKKPSPSMLEDRPIASPSPIAKPDILDLRNPISDKQEDILTLTNPLGSQQQPTSKGSHRELDDSLISHQTLASSADSLSRLAQASKTAGSKRITNLADQRNLTLEQLVHDMIRPLIKEWIDAHLPSLVEDMVAKEINRITTHLKH